MPLGLLTGHIRRVVSEMMPPPAATPPPTDRRQTTPAPPSPPPSTMGGSVRFQPPPSQVPPMTAWGGMPPPSVYGVGAVGVGMQHPMTGYLVNPHAAQLWAEITKPNLFDDKSTDWDQFDREWKRYEQLTAATGLPMPDPIKLEVLKSRVGTVSRLLIQRMEEENPHRTFAEYYGALAKMYAKDASEQARLAWNRVQLKVGPDGILTLDAF